MNNVLKIKSVNKNFFKLSFASIAFAATAAVAGTVAAASASGASHPIVYNNAVYEVPVANELKPYATFAINDLTETKTDAGVEISYTLPAELTGTEGTKVSFIATPSDVDSGADFSLKGANGKADCSFNKTNQVGCNIAYKNLNINSAAIESVLRKKTNNPQEISARLNVAAKFSSEPIGTIRYDLTRK